MILELVQDYRRYNETATYAETLELKMRLMQLTEDELEILLRISND
jgi:hypothetical protein